MYWVTFLVKKKKSFSDFKNVREDLNLHKPKESH